MFVHHASNVDRSQAFRGGLPGNSLSGGGKTPSIVQRYNVIRSMPSNRSTSGAESSAKGSRGGSVVRRRRLLGVLDCRVVSGVGGRCCTPRLCTQREVTPAAIPRRGGNYGESSSLFNFDGSGSVVPTNSQANCMT